VIYFSINKRQYFNFDFIWVVKIIILEVTNKVL